ncbi:hypothetical protein [Caldicellulosiruptor morganii]|uniref:Uncharacterized protein n=1 Tax=Caldicellulosiruptor morganii TaxID=1387555 RepID=A0ABY7BP23_9FIRM|nr:hypothetical protein [Caldicellulosiruptor morganii]WAM34555.1 hypothetical protein OTK00_000770 [Caldicellulosiruptor morganii]
MAWKQLHITHGIFTFILLLLLNYYLTNQPSTYLTQASSKDSKKSTLSCLKQINIDAIIIAECARFSKLNPTPLPDFKYAAQQRLDLYALPPCS